MNQADTHEQVKAELLRLREELLELAETTDASAQVVELDQSKVGRLSRMDAMQAQAMAKASVARRSDALRGIAAALKRIDDGDFGFCGECGEPINPKRLAIDPTIVLCIDCANRAEV